MPGSTVPRTDAAPRLANQTTPNLNITAASPRHIPPNMLNNQDFLVLSVAANANTVHSVYSLVLTDEKLKDPQGEPVCVAVIERVLDNDATDFAGGVPNAIPATARDQHFDNGGGDSLRQPIRFDVRGCGGFSKSDKWYICVAAESGGQHRLINWETIKNCPS